MANIGLNTATSGVLGYQMALDITSNNMANVNTYGFKASRASFADLMYTRVQQRENVDTGHGTKIDKTDLMFEQSELRETYRPLDFAALNEGFFAVERNGQTLYTKDGSFQMTQVGGDVGENGEVEGGDWYLCDASGGFVLDYAGERITIPFLSVTREVVQTMDENEEETAEVPQEPQLDEDGNPIEAAPTPKEYVTVMTTEIDKPALLAKVGIYSFENPYGLDQIGYNYYQDNLSSGPAAANADLPKLQGFLEASSTSIGNEMSKVIEYQRAFQLNANMVKTHNEITDVVNNLRN